jgi:aspartate/methionine/tyrosine aminotransferase
VAEAVRHAAQSTDLGRATTLGRPLTEAIVGKLAEFNALQVDDDQVVVTAGSTAGLCLAAATVCDAHEAVLVPDPGWPGYRRICAAWGIRAIGYPVDWDGRPDYDAVAELARRDVKAIFVSNPHNPTGAVLGHAALTELVQQAARHDLYVISDESYDLIRYHPGPATGPACCDPEGRVIAVYSFAKTHALAGLRLGYLVAGRPLAQAIAATQDALMSGASTLALAAGLAALEMDHSVVDSMRQFYLQQRETLKALLPPAMLPHPPEGGFHALLDISDTDLLDGEAFAAACVAEQGLRLTPGSDFGLRARHCVRLSLAVRERLFGDAMERLFNFLESHGS